jgi:serine/threonine protein kinase
MSEQAADTTTTVATPTVVTTQRVGVTSTTTEEAPAAAAAAVTAAVATTTVDPTAAADQGDTAATAPVVTRDASLSTSSARAWPRTARNYELRSTVGVGAMASVVHEAVVVDDEGVVDAAFPMPVAMKVYDLQRYPGDLARLQRELAILRGAAHANLVRMYASFVDDNCLYVIMPLYTCGSVKLYLNQLQPGGVVDEKLIATVLRDVLLALVHLHSTLIIHRDVKCSNIFVGECGAALLGEFGSHSASAAAGGAARTFVGTPHWMAPEVAENADTGYNEKCDIWSLGISALEFAYGIAPYAKFSQMKAMIMTLTKAPPTVDTYERPERTTLVSPSFRAFLDACLCKEADDRPSANELLSHAFIADNVGIVFVVTDATVCFVSSQSSMTRISLSTMTALRHQSAHKCVYFNSKQAQDAAYVVSTLVATLPPGYLKSAAVAAAAPAAAATVEATPAVDRVSSSASLYDN